MAEEDTGALQTEESEDDKKEAQKTYTEADLQKLISETAEKAKKQGLTEAHRKFQSDLDKETARANKATSELEDFRKKQIESLPEDERDKAMLREVYNRLTSPSSTPKDDDGAKDEDHSSADSDSQDNGGDPRTAAQTELRKIAKEQGLDPDKLDFNDPKKFFEGIREQLSKRSDDDEKDEDNAGGPVDGGTGSAGRARKDMTKVNPRTLMANGYKRRRRGIA